MMWNLGFTTHTLILSPHVGLLTSLGCITPPELANFDGLLGRISSISHKGRHASGQPMM
jgi:hypothetical protein